ncbi:hypothetical protein PLANPX_1211 [Lacipirellula parvula]|uniref:Uncharacterized protein n=1 Tax=Lacipirellula parvula TaxID=2650471 RepID=A0A5K7XF32_9BACT|nr:hypothetical protein PLANPX_1211 [Lacipirellula parvula]
MGKTVNSHQKEDQSCPSLRSHSLARANLGLACRQLSMEFQRKLYASAKTKESKYRFALARRVVAQVAVLLGKLPLVATLRHNEDAVRSGNAWGGYAHQRHRGTRSIHPSLKTCQLACSCATASDYR